MALKKMKMFEKELQKLDGQAIMLEQQKMMIESTTFDQDVIAGMKTGATTMKQMNDQMQVEELEELKDDLADQMADMEDRQAFFAEAAEGDADDELLAELDGLEADAVGAEIDGMEVGVTPLSAPA